MMNPFDIVIIKNLNSSDKVVLIVLAKYQLISENTEIILQNGDIASAVNLSLKTVYNSLKRLKDKNFISVEYSPTKGRVITLNHLVTKYRSEGS